MEIELRKYGKFAFPETEAQVNVYLNRLKRFVRCHLSVIKEQKITNLKREPTQLWVLLDEKGEHLDSVGLSQCIEKIRSEGRFNNLVFMIGPPYGFPQEVMTQANWIWSLSQLTLTSDIATLVVAEQIYRALTIIHGLPYHHGSRSLIDS